MPTKSATMIKISAIVVAADVSALEVFAMKPIAERMSTIAIASTYPMIGRDVSSRPKQFTT